MSTMNESSLTSSKTNEALWIEIVSAVVCVLSMVGSLAIIVTFVFVKDIRSKARELLVHLSLMDLMYASANFIGLWMPYRKYLNSGRNSSAYHTYHRVCQVQAFMAVYGTIGSVLWTLGLAVYLYYRIVSRDDNVTRRVVVALYIFCYSLPLYVSLWLLLNDRLGYPNSPIAGGGWCSTNDKADTLETFMTYDIWMWMGIIALVPLYLTIHVHIRDEVKKHKNNPEYHILIAINNPAKVKTEIKLLFIPLVFIFLRVWDVIDSILFSYQHSTAYKKNHYDWLQLLTAIGDCGQGFFNFVIFFMFQPRLREILIKGGQHCCCCCCHRASQWWTQLHKKKDTTQQLRSGKLIQPINAPLTTVTEDFSQYTLHI